MSTNINPANLPPLGTHTSDGRRAGAIFPGSGRVFTNSTGQFFYQNVPSAYLNSSPGVQLSPRNTYRIQPLQSATGNIVNSGTNNVGPGYLTLLADLTTTQRIIFNGQTVTVLDVPRTLTVTRSSTSDAANVYIWGWNGGEANCFEQIQLSSGTGSATGNIAFKYILAVYVSEVNQWQVGTSNILGLPYYVQTFGDISNPIWNNAALPANAFTAGDTTNPPTVNSGDPRGLINLGLEGLTAPNGTIWLCLDTYIQGADIGNPGPINPNMVVGVPPYYIPMFSS